MADSAKVTLRGRFSPGQKVSLFEAAGDWFSPNVNVVKTATVKNDGSVTFDNLPEGRSYFAATEEDGAWRHARVTAKEPQEVTKEGPRYEAGKFNPTLVSQREHTIHVGARNTDTVVRDDRGRESVFAGQHIGLKTEGKVDEAQPHLRQEDISDSVPQRSSTLTGEATPKDKDEEQPRVTQEAVSDKQPQRSSTPEGEATPKDKKEDVPSAEQDAASGKQRSDTPEGEAEPKPKGSKVEVQKRKDSAKERAAGHTPQNPREKKLPKKAAKKKAAKKRR